MPSTPLSTALREGTRPEHEQAEHSGFIVELLAGRAPASHYTALAAQQHTIYSALEEVGEALADDPIAGPFFIPELVRLPSIERDLAHLIGPDWRSEVNPLPATRAYAERILAMRDWPAGFVAHHYTRYLGDLAGGQSIRATMEREYGLDARGTEFYHFADIPKVKLFRDEYRARLDAIEIDPEERERMLDEARRAFRLNQAVFEALGAATAVP